MRRETKPNIVSQALWTVIQTIAIIAQLQSGWSWSVVILVATTINTLTFTILCLKGYGYKGYGWIDGVCLFGAIGALLAWRVTGEPVTALVIAVCVNIFASLPTIVKVFRYPETENATAWLMMSVASILSIFSVTSVSVANLVFPVEFFIESTLIGGLALLGRKKLLQQG
ncbi:MAG: hypothetical protein IPJ68_01745 [Candidatus Moraniibacteriota bacterium]|nr:MAG: hypothetical protein IPJ68_01745 [Candidatus Moranbacteria bacterium]